MRFRALAIIATVGLALAGCQPKTLSELSYTELKAVEGQIRQRCYAQGIREGSPEWGNCAQQEIRRESATRERAVRRFDSDTSISCQTFGSTTVCN